VAGMQQLLMGDLVTIINGTQGHLVVCNKHECSRDGAISHSLAMQTLMLAQRHLLKRQPGTALDALCHSSHKLQIKQTKQCLLSKQQKTTSIINACES
jgi:hypothetical protein